MNFVSRVASLIAAVSLLTAPMLARASPGTASPVKEAAKGGAMVIGGAVAAAIGAATSVGAGATVAMTSIGVGTAIALGGGYLLIGAGVILAGYGLYKVVTAFTSAPPSVSSGSNVERREPTREVGMGPAAPSGVRGAGAGVTH